MTASALRDCGRLEHPEVQACSVWSFPGEYRDRGVVRWNGCRVDYILAGGALTLDPAARPGHAQARGSPAAGVAAGAAPEPQRTGTPPSADMRDSEASPEAASSAQAPEQVLVFAVTGWGAPDAKTRKGPVHAREALCLA